VMDFNIGVPPDADGQSGVARLRIFPLKGPLDKAPAFPPRASPRGAEAERNDRAG
jgi:hypothetical protein